MKEDLKALIDRVRELRAQLDACKPEERSRRIELGRRIEELYIKLGAGRSKRST